MNTADTVCTAAAFNPTDNTCRSALADLIREAGEGEDLAAAVESAAGINLLVKTKKYAEEAELPVTLRLLWCVYYVLPRLKHLELRNVQPETPVRRTRIYADDPYDPVPVTPRPADELSRVMNRLERTRSLIQRVADAQEGIEVEDDGSVEAPIPQSEYERMAAEINARLIREGLADGPVANRPPDPDDQ